MWRSLIATCSVGAALLASPLAAVAQDAAEPEVEAAAADDLLGPDALDDLVAPVALYPDALLAQVLVAATVPLDVMKADRFLDENAGLADKERADAAAAEDWDESVAVLAGGFPEVVQRMADDIDWTQDVGDAMVVQTDDVFDAVQRMRARAEAAGNLGSNEAQTVESDGEAISIAPADPNVVYVPSYDPVSAYTTTSVPTTTAVPVDNTVGNLVTAGAVAFGTSMIVDAIFDDDDDWDDYWRGPPAIHWNDDNFHPRPGVNVNGDVNVDVDRRVRIGNRIGGTGSGWKPTPQQRAAAKDRLAARKVDGKGLAGHRLPKGVDQATRDRIRAKAEAGDVKKRLQAGGGNHPAGGIGQTARDKIAARGDGGGVHKRPPAGKRPNLDGKKHLEGKKPGGGSALAPKAGGRKHADRVAARGSESLKRDHAPHAAKDRAKAAAKAKSISRPAKPKAPHRAAPPKRSAFEKHGSGHRAKAASARGHAHAKRRH